MLRCGHFPNETERVPYPIALKKPNAATSAMAACECPRARPLAIPVLSCGRVAGDGKTLRHLGVFAKYWQAGEVKTRLAATIGPVAAAEVYREFIRHTLIRHSGSGDLRSVCVWPPQRLAEFQSVLPAASDWKIEPQCPGDLGQRMQDFFRRSQALDSGRRTVLIGSDSPQLSPRLVEQAFQALATCDCVLGPALDGGYYLIGLSVPGDSVFEGISWSSERVLEQTIARLQEGGLTWHRLPPVNDVDDFEDLRQRFDEALSAV
jgi:rSAM/selenodomain-associated transferase 1